jgi:hypothetical protein
MAVTVPITPDSSPSAAKPRERSRVLVEEWPIYAVLLASASIVIGLIWDISWHRTIGRDTFWSPPHVIEQIGAAVSGLACGYLALRTTFAGSSADKGKSVRFWNFFQAPLGAWVCIWGTIMMITSAPFDNWWHNAYGLDVKIISPPHAVLAAGMIGIELGAMLMAVGAQNRAEDEATRRRLGWVFIIAAAIIVQMVMVMITEDASFANQMHSSRFYKATGLMVPIFLVAFARASRLSWPATRIAAIYMIISVVAIWTLQLFPATPKLAPIYNPVTHMVPPAFPLLLVIPAVFVDIMLTRNDGRNDWVLALKVGLGFVGIMLAVHWFWSYFMLSPYARNFFFAADQWDYSNRAGPWQHRYWNRDVDAAGNWSAMKFGFGILIAGVMAVLSSRIGLAWGKGMSRIKR